MDLKILRKKIDKLDQQLVYLLSKRAALSRETGKLKRKRGRGAYVPDRESQVLSHVARMNRGPLSRQSLEAIWREVMSASLSLEGVPKIAYLGPAYTFTHQASLKKFGSSVEYVPCDTISDVFAEVENNRSDYGVVPVENSTEGAIHHTFDMFIESDLKICSEVLLNISLNLLTRCKRLSEIKAVYSNPQVFGQCRDWIESHLPGVELRGISSTTKAAEVAARERHVACIASSLAGPKYHLRNLASSIQDDAQNKTRFLVISKEPAKPTGRDKTSIMLSIKDRVGALQAILSPFKRCRINLTKIESRPSRKRAWDYYFFIDFEGHSEDRKSSKALAMLERESSFLKILGSYPQAL